MTRRLLAIAAMTLVIAACSGSPDASGPDDGGAGSSSGAEPSAAASTGGGGGGGGAADACELITADEAASVMGMDLESEPTPGDTSYCIYSGADSTAVVATSFNATNANDIMAAFGGQAGVTEVSGIGDRALWDSNSATLFVAKGDAVVGITAGDGSMDPAQRQDYSEQLGAIAAGRM